MMRMMRMSAVRPCLWAMAMALLLAVLAVVWLVLQPTTSVQAQGAQKTPSAPTVLLSTCDNGCITVGIQPLTFTDGTAMNHQTQLYRKSDGSLHPVLETQWKETGTEEWTPWRRLSSPADRSPGVRYQSLTGKGLFEIRFLEHDTSYDVRMRVHHVLDPYNYDANEHTTSDWSQTGTFTTTGLKAVTGLTISQSGGRGVTFSWTDPTGIDYDKYFVAVNAKGVCHCGPGAGVVTDPPYTWSSVTKEKTVTVTGFEPGATVQACVRPVIGSKTGSGTARSASITVGFPTGTVARVPSAPQLKSVGYGEMEGSDMAPSTPHFSLRAENAVWNYHTGGIVMWPTYTPTHTYDRGLLDWDKLYLAWERADENGAYVTGSEWQYREVGSSDWLAGSTADGYDRWDTHPNPAAMTDGAAYEFRVRSKNSAGWGQWSNTVELLNKPKTSNPWPVQVGMSSPHNGFVGLWSVGWNHPEWTGTYFHDGIEWRHASIKEYHVTVTQPGIDQPLYDKTTSLSMERNCRASDYVRAPHNQVNYPYTDERYRRIPCSDRDQRFYVNIKESKVDTSRALHVTVRAKNNSNEETSVATITFGPFGPPAPPTDIAVTIDDDDNHHFSWTASTDDGGARLTHYLVRGSCATLAGGTNRKADFARNVPVPETSVKVSTTSMSAGNQPGTMHCYGARVQAVNHEGYNSEPLHWAPPKGNIAPQVLQAPGSVYLDVGTSKDVSLSGVFHDMDGDPLTITASSANENNVTVTVADDFSSLTVNARCCPEVLVMVTVTATDPDNGRVALQFKVFPQEPERATFDPMVYDTNGNGRIDKPEFANARRDYSKCHIAGWRLESSKLECDTGESGHPMHNLNQVRSAHEWSRVDVSFSPNPVSEGEGTVTLTATLSDAAALTASGVVLTVSVVDNDGDLNVEPTTITINSGEKSGTTTVTVIDDELEEPTEKFLFEVEGLVGTSSVGGVGELTVHDNDREYNLVLSPKSLRIDEGDSDRYLVHLSNSPTSNVTVTAISSDRTAAYTTPGTLTFTTSNWQTHQRFSVDTQNDLDGDDETVILRHTLSSDDSNYNGIAAPSVTVTVVETPPLQQQPRNYAPTVASAIDDATIVHQTGTHEVSLSDVFTDAENDRLRFTSASSDVDKATVAISGSTLTVTAKATGTATITVTANDGNGGTVDDTFTVTVKAAPTVASAIADISGLEEDASQDVSLTNTFRDADNDALTITASSSDTGKATVTVATDRSKLTVTGVAEGTATMTVTASDPDGNTVSDAFDVSVVPAPEPGVKDYSELIAEMYNRRNNSQWSSHKSHTDRWDRALLAFGETVEDKTLTSMTAAEAQAFADRGWVIWERVAAALREIEQAQTQQQGVANNAPTVASAISDATIVNASGTKSVSLAGVFADEDGDSLTITAVSSDTAKATVSVVSDQATLTVTAKARGTATITVTANDGNGSTVSDEFTVTVKAAPTVSTAIADISLEEGAPWSHDLSTVFSDADGDSLTYAISSSDTGVATVFLLQSQLSLFAMAKGIATITVTAQDSNSNEARDTFNVTVVEEAQTQQQPRNNVPTVASAIDDATIVHQSGTHEVSLSGVFTDADNDTLTITATSSDTDKATVAISGSTLTVTAKARGTATITVTANDGNGGTVSDEFTVTVKAAPTVASAIADISGLEVGDTREVSLSGVFTDADGDSLTITAASSDTAKATVSVASDGSNLTLTGVAEGKATVTVTASDSDGNTVSDEFQLGVAKKYATLIAQMWEWRNDPARVNNEGHTDLWDRALLAFSETVDDSTLTPMKADEAQGYADRGWNRWVKVAKAMKEIEAG